MAQTRREEGSGRKKVCNLSSCLKLSLMYKSDAQLEPSDEEILGYSESEDEDVEDEDDVEDEPNQPDVSDAEGQEEEEGWGLSKKDYYNNDEILTEEQAREEEEEARRIQQKRLAKMTAADFGLDDIDFEGAKDDGEYEKGDVITEVLPDIEITPEMGPEERYGILQSRYPEFDFLADEFLALHPLLEDLKKQVEAQPPRALLDPLTTTEIKCRALVAYLSCLAMYFAIFASPARDRGINKPLPPDELQDHEVMDTLLQCRQTWNKVKSLKAPKTLVPKPEETISVPDTESSEETDRLPAEPTKKSRKQKAIEAELSAASKQRAQRLEADLSDLNALLPKSLTKSKSSRPVTFIHESDNSDFGEEDVLSARDAATKAQRKKNLSFYTSQIAQKANKRGVKGREAGGDEDVPHRERLRDRQDRLNREAEARAKKFDSYGRGKATDADLGAGSDDEVQNGVATKVRGEEDEYYDLISKTSKAKKAAKETERAAIREAKAQNALVRVVEGEMDEEGKRAIGYVIEKNKVGLHSQTMGGCSVVPC
jgi:U3 small nucleolar RNA-associated protein 3